MNGYCINCGCQMLPCDDDPNGDKNAVCAKCRAEEAHDFDVEPNVTFSRSGEREVKKHRVKADDIKHQNRLTRETIADIPLDNVYEWIRTGAWKFKDFKTWCRALRITD